MSGHMIFDPVGAIVQKLLQIAAAPRHSVLIKPEV